MLRTQIDSDGWTDRHTVKKLYAPKADFGGIIKKEILAIKRLTFMTILYNTTSSTLSPDIKIWVCGSETKFMQQS